MQVTDMMSKPLPLLMLLLLLMMMMTMDAPGATRSYTSCTAVTTDKETTVVCHFEENVVQSKRDFNVKFFYPNHLDNPSSETVLACNRRESGELRCYNSSDVNFDKNQVISDRLVFTRPASKDKEGGEYLCNAVPALPGPSHHCTLTYIETTTQSTSSPTTTPTREKCEDDRVTVIIVWLVMVTVVIVCLVCCKRKSIIRWWNRHSKKRDEDDPPERSSLNTSHDQPGDNEIIPESCPSTSVLMSQVGRSEMQPEHGGMGPEAESGEEAIGAEGATAADPLMTPNDGRDDQAVDVLIHTSLPNHPRVGSSTVTYRGKRQSQVAKESGGAEVDRQNQNTIPKQKMQPEHERMGHETESAVEAFGAEGATADDPEMTPDPPQEQGRKQQEHKNTQQAEEVEPPGKPLNMLPNLGESGSAEEAIGAEGATAADPLMTPAQRRKAEQERAKQEKKDKKKKAKEEKGAKEEAEKEERETKQKAKKEEKEAKRKAEKEKEAKRKAEKEEKEAKQKAEKEEKKAKKEAEKEDKEAKRKAKKEEKEAKHETEKEEKEAKRKAKKEEKEAKRKAEKEEREAEKEAEKEKEAKQKTGTQVQEAKLEGEMEEKEAEKKTETEEKEAKQKEAKWKGEEEKKEGAARLSATADLPTTEGGEVYRQVAF